MTSIQPWSWNYVPPPPPSAPPADAPPPVYQTMPDGTLRQVDVIIVIGQRNPNDPLREALNALQAYGGLGGAQENFRRDMEFAMGSPEERAIMLGMNPYAEDGFSRDGELGNAAEGIDEIDYQIFPPGEAIDLIRQEVEERYTNSIDNYVLGAIGEEAAQRHLQTRGLQLVEKQVRVLVTGDDGKPKVRIYDMLVRDALGNLKFIEVKTNSGVRNARQTEADLNMSANGGTLATSKPSLSGLPRSLPPIPVDVWNIFLPPKGT